jgi:hypothetical protein
MRINNESQGFRKKDLQRLQGNQETWCIACDMHESASQTKTKSSFTEKVISVISRG